MSQNKKFILLCIAEFTTTISEAIVKSAKALANAVPADETPDSADAPNPPTEEKPKRRGRPPGATEPGAATLPAAEPDKEAATGKQPEDPLSDEALKTHIRPLVDEGRGAEVVTTIKSHGGTKISDLPKENRQAFHRDIEALKM